MKGMLEVKREDGDGLVLLGEAENQEIQGVEEVPVGLDIHRMVGTRTEKERPGPQRRVPQGNYPSLERMVKGPLNREPKVPGKEEASRGIGVENCPEPGQREQEKSAADPKESHGVLLREPDQLIDDKQGAGFDLLKDPADIFADEPEGQELNAAEQEQKDGDGGMGT